MTDIEIWSRYFPEFVTSRDEDTARLMKSAKEVNLAIGKIIFEPGDACCNYLLILEGVAKVYLMTSGGREAMLYQVTTGEACILTTSCLLGTNHYPAYGVTETPVSALAIPAEAFHRGIAHSAFFREFVFSGFAERLSRVIGRMETWVDRDIDQMLARALLESAQNGKVHTTHQGLAVAIGSAREVVSRHLKQLEAKSWIKLSRGCVEIMDHTQLRKLADSPKSHRDNDLTSHKPNSPDKQTVCSP